MNFKVYQKRVLSLAVLLLLCLLAGQAHAQRNDSLLSVYTNQTIHSFGNVYMKGGKRLTFRDLNNEFEPGTARDLYLESKRKLTLSKALLVVSTASLVGSAILRKNEDKGGLALLVIGIGINLGNYRIRQKSTQLVDRALWIRNKEVLFSVKE